MFSGIGWILKLQPSWVIWGSKWVWQVKPCMGKWSHVWASEAMYGQYLAEAESLSWIGKQKGSNCSSPLQWPSGAWLLHSFLWCKHEFHETCHSVTFYFMKKRLQTMLWHHNARVNSHQRWKQTWSCVCFHLWCELTSTLNSVECNRMTSFMEFMFSDFALGSTGQVADFYYYYYVFYFVQIDKCTSK